MEEAKPRAEVGVCSERGQGRLSLRLVALKPQLVQRGAIDIRILKGGCVDADELWVVRHPSCDVVLVPHVQWRRWWRRVEVA